MFSKTVTTTIFALALTLITLPVSVLAADQQAGMVIIAAGDVSAHKEGASDRPLSRRSKFYTGEIIMVGDNGKAQVRFLDGTILSLTSGTALRIDAFNYENNAGADDANIVTLLKGGFRTITGAVAKKNPANHQVNTPVATIGVRGTNYSVAIDDSVYVGVWDGVVFVENDGGSIELGKRLSYSYASITSTTDAPKGLVEPPPVLVETVAVNQTTPTTEVTEPVVEVATVESSEQQSLSPQVADTATTDNTNPFEAITASKTDLRLSDTEKAGLNNIGILTLTSSGINYTADSTNGSSGKPVLVSETINADTGFPEKVISSDSATSASNISSALIGNKEVHWGSWNNAYVQTDPQDPSIKEVIAEKINWMTVDPTDSTVLANLKTTGSWYGTIATGNFSGSADNDTTIQSLSYSSDINFGTGDITGTFLQATTSTDVWNVDFNPGTLEGSQFSLTANTSSSTSLLTRTPDITSDSITGSLSGVITGDAATGIAAQFRLEGVATGATLDGQFVSTCITCP